MKNLHTKLEQYVVQCDEVFLSGQLAQILKEAHEAVEQIEPEVLYTVGEKIIMLDVREPEEFSSGYITAHEVLTIPRGKLEFMP